jgi:hypothetical protein
LDNKQVIDGVRNKLAETTQAKNDKTLKLLALLGRPKPHIYFLLWKNDVKQNRIDQLTEDKKNKIMLLLALMGRPKPHMFFLLWKNQCKNDKIA